MNKKGCEVRRQVGRPGEVNVSTQISPPKDEIGKRNGDLRNKLPVELSNKRKTVPALEDREVDRKKRAKREDSSYAGVCKEREKGDGEARDKAFNDSGDEWIVQTSRRERRRERKRSINERRRSPANEGRREKLTRTRNRPETLLV